MSSGRKKLLSTAILMQLSVSYVHAELNTIADYTISSPLVAPIPALDDTQLSGMRDIRTEYQATIAKNWIVPLDTSGLSLTVRIQLNEDGTIKSVEVTHSSGNDNLDVSVIGAIYKSAPFSMPDDPRARKMAQNFTSVFTSK